MLGLAIAVATSVAGVRGTQDAIANGDTRTINLTHAHRNDSVSITFRRNGRYDPDALEQLNWFLRDWRTDQRTKMEPRLFDIIWEVYREAGSRDPVVVLSAYRAPETNAMLRRRSRAVSEHSQHMLGKAMDIRMPDVDTGRVRAIAIRLQHGGVGFYGASGFVHLDAGSVRAWPRMTQDQLARLFPDGKTVHLPPSGKPFARYEEARAEILARGDMVGGYGGAEDGAATSGRRSLWATLFGGGDEDTEDYGATGGGRGVLGARNATAYAPAASGGRSTNRTQVAAASASEASAPSSRFRFFWEKDPEPPQAAAAEEPLQTASLPPIPPRRPDEIAASLLDVPIPPARPIELAAIFSSPPASADSRARFAPDERAALRALFVAAATASPAPSPARPAPVATTRAKPQPLAASSRVVADLGPALNLGFSSMPTGDLTVTAFTGPAVKPLPVLR